MAGELIIADDATIQVVEEPLEVRLDPDHSDSLHADILQKLIARRDFSLEYCEDRYDEWNRVRRHLKMYIDLSAKARMGDRSESTTDLEMPFQRSITIPLSYSTLQVLVSQMISIYAARVPELQVQGREGGDIFKSNFMEAMLAYDSQQTRLYSQFYSAFKDGLAFGCGPIYDSWEVDEGITQTYEPLIVPGFPPEILTAMLGPMAYTPVRKWGVRREYNRFRSIDPYCFRWDPRVAPSEIQEGEFAGHKWQASWMALQKRSGENGPYFNLEHLPERSIESLKNEYKDSVGINDRTLDSRTRDPRDRGYYNCETMCVELIPVDWKLGDSEQPERWLFSWAEDDIIIRAHPLANAHQMYPYSVVESDIDPHSTFAPGVIELIEPLQRFVNWLYNSHVSNIIAMVNNQYIYSPRFVEQMDVEYGGPGEHIRMKDEAVDLLLNGEIQDIRQFFSQVQVQDVTGPVYMNAIQYTYQMAQLMTGANDPLSGIQLPTERSATEIQTITAKASDRIAIMAKLIDQNAIEPLVQRMIANRQQFTQIAQYYRIAGEAAKRLMLDNIFLDMTDIQGQFDYLPVTGILPEDPARSAQVWSNVMSAAAQLPQLQQPGPDGQMLDFREVFKTIAEKQGIKNLDRYFINVNVVPDQQAQNQEQAGNYVPLPAGSNQMMVQ